MSRRPRIELPLRIAIAVVWALNGIVAKVLELVPRHQAIVERVVGTDHARTATVAIGLGECALAAWIASGRMPRATAALQIGLVASMNVIEARLAPELLLWGQANLLFAALFCAVVAWHGFVLAPARG